MGTGAFHPKRSPDVVTELHTRSEPSRSRASFTGASNNLTATVIQFPGTQNRNFQSKQNYERHEHIRGRFDIVSFREHENPELAIRVQQIQGESYSSSPANYVYKTALVDPLKDTRLLESYDTARASATCDVEYFYGYSTDNPEMGEGGVRVVTVRPGHSYEELPAYEHSASVLTENAKETINHRATEFGPQIIKEIAALSFTNQAKEFDKQNARKDPNVSIELIRNLLQRAVRNNTRELWLINFAEPAQQQLMQIFGPRVLQRIGNNIKAHVGDPRRNDTLELVPTMVEACDLLDNLVDTIEELHDRSYVLPPDQFLTFQQYLDAQAKLDVKKARDQKIKQAMTDNLLFLVDGLKDHELSPKVYGFMHPTDDPNPDKKVS